jgi:hypothetical protein
MRADENSAGQPAGAEALFAEFERQIARVGVDPQLAFSQLNQIAAPTTRPLPDGSYEESFTMDASGIVEMLRRLPDNAGTAAFVAAYNAAHPDFHPPAI